MKPQSRRIIHVGINFVTAPPPVIDSRSYLGFQQAILSHGLEFTQVTHQEKKIIVTRQVPTALQLTVNVLGPQVGQILVVAPQPGRSLELFIQEVEAAVEAFHATWPAQNRQVIGCDATLRDLYETTSEHAFQELWEGRLKQSSQSLTALGRPVLGGGLRFVMPPLAEEPEPVQIEVKIESFLKDTSKIFVEARFTWTQPTAPGRLFNPRERLLQVNTYVEDQVVAFIMGGPNDF